MALFMKLIDNSGIEKFLELFRLVLHKIEFGFKVFHVYFALYFTSSVFFLCALF